MLIFDEITKKGHEQVVFCHDEASGLRAIIAIHDTTLGPALGGTRFYPYEDDEAALIDVLRLSRGMTYKSAASGLNLGGGKAVIIGNPKKLKSEQLFRAYGRFVQGLAGRYITAEDVGTTVRDMEWVRHETDFVTGISRALGGSGDPSPMTALGVFEGMRAALAFRTGKESVDGVRVSVQGVGAVGRHLVDLLVHGGAQVVICDIDQQNLKMVTTKHPEILVVEPDDIYDAAVDVYAPCAMGATLNPGTIGRLKASVVAGSANNQLALEDRDGAALAERDILYSPDYVINAGGLINVANELEGYNDVRARQQVKGIHDIILDIFKLARSEGRLPYKAANTLALRRIEGIGRIKNHWCGVQTQKRGCDRVI
ncbi:MAG: Glu/Leu/Phe/Val dehydrogenase [Myxococcales bacterium]|nr:Glu/Leu/Phe/Val dehydrogenase [Myxococcales bacterium]